MRETCPCVDRAMIPLVVVCTADQTVCMGDGDSATRLIQILKAPLQRSRARFPSQTSLRRSVIMNVPWLHAESLPLGCVRVAQPLGRDGEFRAKEAYFGVKHAPTGPAGLNVAFKRARRELWPRLTAELLISLQPDLPPLVSLCCRDTETPPAR